MRVLALALTLALSGCFGAPAMAQPKPPKCIALERLVDTAPDGFRLKPVSGEAHFRAVMFYNSLPPVSNRSFGLVVWGEGPQGAALFFGNNGEICEHMAIERDRLEAFRLMIFGPVA